jgi:uncharacterized membrane-anchored protein YitT (DUF2179 family)
MKNEEKQQTTVEEPVPTALPPKITKENIYPQGNGKWRGFLRWARAILYTLLSSFLVSVASYTLIAPNHFTIGGITGVAVLLELSPLHWQQSITVLCLNVPLIVLAFFFVKKRFAVLSTLNILMQSLWLMLLENFGEEIRIAFAGDAERIFAVVAAGLLVGVSIVLAFKAGGSTGGSDILAVLIQKKLAAASIAWILFAMNCIVIGASFFIIDVEGDLAHRTLPIMLAVLEAYIESKTNESITNGFQSAIEFRIITDKAEEMATALMTELSRCTTCIPAKGMYTKVEHSMLVCVVSRRQVPILKRVMHEIDPDAFAVMSNVSQVLGLGFYSSEN